MKDVSVRLDGAGDVAEVVVSRATTGNSLTPEVGKALADAIVEAGSVARCVVLRTEGRVFCSGGDIGFLEGIVDADPEEIAGSIYTSFQAVVSSIARCPVPVIARVQGMAAGAGCDVALACDLVVASEQAAFEESWIRIGTTSALAGALHLTRGIGRHRALELLLTGRRVPAAEAEQLGLVNVVVPPDELDSAVERLTLSVAHADPAAVAAMKQLVRLSQQADFDQALEHGLRLQTALLAKPEFGRRLDSLRQRLDRSTKEGSRAR